MKILNLYAGLGGNRKLWSDEHEVVAVEKDPELARLYKDRFPADKVVVGDAHQYLLDHYDEFDFIWSSPPCPTHSRIRNLAGVGRGQNKPVYPDMSLYQEIIFLQRVYETKGTSFNGKYVVENVISYYEPLIRPQKRARHYFWANFYIPEIRSNDERAKSDITMISGNEKNHYGFSAADYHGEQRKGKILRNCVDPELGLHILQAASKEQQVTLV